ncbi:MAG: hypothetical protein U0354_06115 [Candidatus Sericytochromatia bacterium]
MSSNSTSSNNSVLYLFFLTLFVSFFVILLFSQSTNKTLTSSDTGDPTFLASVYIPINFDEEITEEPIVTKPKIEVSKPKQLPVKVASKDTPIKKSLEEIKIIPRVISTPIPERKKSAVMSYAISSYKAPIEVIRPRPQVIYEKPRVIEKPKPVYEKPRKTSAPDTSNLEREIQALALKKLEKEISGK